MRKYGKKSCGCNQQKQSCGCNNNSNECAQYKQCANEKCEKAECLSNKANKIAQQAIAAEQKAECLKQQAIEECKRANELWAQYNQIADESVCLMKQAEACLSKSVECYKNLYEDVEGCNLADFGYKQCQEKPQPPCGGCNCGCGCR